MLHSTVSFDPIDIVDSPSCLFLLCLLSSKLVDQRGYLIELFVLKRNF